MKPDEFQNIYCLTGPPWFPSFRHIFRKRRRWPMASVKIAVHVRFYVGRGSTPELGHQCPSVLAGVLDTWFGKMASRSWERDFLQGNFLHNSKGKWSYSDTRQPQGPQVSHGRGMVVKRWRWLYSFFRFFRAPTPWHVDSHCKLQKTSMRRSLPTVISCHGPSATHPRQSC